jgi:hypothetical protein
MAQKILKFFVVALTVRAAVLYSSPPELLLTH